MREELRGNASSLADLRALHQMDPSGLSATLGEMAAIRLMRQERENEAEKVCAAQYPLKVFASALTKLSFYDRRMKFLKSRTS